MPIFEMPLGGEFAALDVQRVVSRVGIVEGDGGEPRFRFFDDDPDVYREVDAQAHVDHLLLLLGRWRSAREEQRAKRVADAGKAPSG